MKKPKKKEDYNLYVTDETIFTIVVRHTIENGWYPSSDNKCMDLAKAIVKRIGKGG